MEIPHQQLSPESLHGLIEDFVTRDGTDYGASELSMEQKYQKVLRELQKGKVVIVYDTATESCNIMTRNALNTMNNSLQKETGNADV